MSEETNTNQTFAEKHGYKTACAIGCLFILAGIAMLTSLPWVLIGLGLAVLLCTLVTAAEDN